MNEHLRSLRWVALLALALPWVQPFAPGPSPNVAPWLVTAACALLALALAQPVAPARKLWLAVAAFVLLVALRPAPALLDRFALAGGCALVLVAYAIGRGAAVGGERLVAVIAGAWLAAALLSSAMGLLQYFDGAGALQPWVYAAKAGEALSNLRQRNQLASLTAIGLAAALWLGARSRSGLAAWIPAVVVLAAANAATTSRTGLLQWLVVAGLTAWWDGPQRKRGLQLCAAGLLAYAAAAVLLPLVLEARTGLPAETLFGRLEADLGCSSRRVLWGNVLQLVRERPLWGWGWGELDYAHYMHLYGAAPRFCDILDNAHNLPLHIAVELGLPMALLFCVLIAVALVRTRPWREAHAGRQLAWCVLAVLAIHSLLEYPLWYGPFQLALGLALGLLASGADAAPIGDRARAAIVAGGLALVGYTAWDYERVSQIYLDPEQRLSAWREDTLEQVRRSWLFAGQAGFAELTITPLTRADLQWQDKLSRALLHYSPEPRVIERVIETATMQDRYDEAVLHLARYRAAFPQDYAKWRAAQKLPMQQ